MKPGNLIMNFKNAFTSLPPHPFIQKLYFALLAPFLNFTCGLFFISLNSLKQRIAHKYKFIQDSPS